ncbi:unnamed protein product [Heligmosomoides polygyrus]|uniref:Endo/exonuclease/phosphatase domain-containing protein n=1 Tax=Heligmosomoides polygyrus TaxID=6339 RepID=A0A183FW98_HELPZ|nr:unnamed protein product [Heligmosomoides polygyrus]
MTICTYNARTLASKASVEDLMMQARRIKYDVIGLTETSRHHPLHATYDSGEELFLGTCDSRESLTPYDGPRNPQFYNEIDRIIFNRKYCLTDVSVVPKFYTGSDHCLNRAMFRFSGQGEKAAKFKKRNPRTTISWEPYTSLVGLWEDTVMDNIDEEYGRFEFCVTAEELWKWGTAMECFRS